MYFNIADLCWTVDYKHEMYLQDHSPSFKLHNHHLTLPGLNNYDTIVDSFYVINHKFNYEDSYFKIHVFLSLFIQSSALLYNDRN